MFSSIYVIKEQQNVYNTCFDDLYGIGIPEVFMNIMSCRIFVQEQQYTVILTCRIVLVSYYLFKGFLLFKKGWSR